jgi:hypothetical protein
MLRNESYARSLWPAKIISSREPIAAASELHQFTHSRPSMACLCRLGQNASHQVKQQNVVNTAISGRLPALIFSGYCNGMRVDLISRLRDRRQV